MSKALTEKLPTLLMAAVMVVSVAAAGAVVGAQSQADGTDAATETDDPATQATSYLRVVHASPDAGPVNVSLDNETVLENVSVTEASDYQVIESGERNVTVTAADGEGEVYFSENVTFAPRTVTTLAASGEVGAEESDALDVTLENETNVTDDANETDANLTDDANATEANETDAGQPFQPVLLDDNAYEPEDGESALSVVHLSPDAGTVDVVVDVSEANTTEDVELSVTDDGTELVVEEGETNATDADASADETELVLADNVSYQNATDYATLPAGDYPVEIRNATAENDGEEIATVDVTLDEETAHSAMAVGYENTTDAAGDTPFQAVLTEDATTDVRLPSEETPEEAAATDNGTDAVDGLFGDENDTESPAAADNDSAAVTFDPQTSNGSTVTVDSVTVPESGYVAIHNASLQDGEVVGSVVGVSEYLEAGTHEDVEVTLYDVSGVDFQNESLSGDETLTAMPHQETNENETYDFVATNGSDDPAYTVGGEAVTDEGYVNIELDEAPAEEAPDDDTLDEEPADNDTLDEEPADNDTTSDALDEQPPDGEVPTDNETTNDTLDEQPPDGEVPTDNETTNDTLDEQPPDGEVPTDNDTTNETLDEEPADNETADNDTGNGLFG